MLSEVQNVKYHRKTINFKIKFQLPVKIPN